MQNKVSDRCLSSDDHGSRVEHLGNMHLIFSGVLLIRNASLVTPWRMLRQHG